MNSHLFFQDRQDSLRSSEVFKDLARRDAEETMAEELEKLLATAPDKTREVCRLISVVGIAYLIRMYYLGNGNL